MASANKVLKENQFLFHNGDKSDGMYLIRNGELQVLLEKDGEEVVLATIKTGAMVGEMALFDKKPRSASVKAIKNTEVTHVSTEDFAKLMRQIPKWFVGLMGSLSSRLRDTNNRLQALEDKLKKDQIGLLASQKYLQVLLLVWSRDGKKDQKEHTLELSELENILIDSFHETKKNVNKFISILVECEYFETSKNSYNGQVLKTSDKGALVKLLDFVNQFLKGNEKANSLSVEALKMLALVNEGAKKSPYDSYCLSLVDMIKTGKQLGHETENWKNHIAEFKSLGGTAKLVKTSDGIGLKVDKAEIKLIYRSHAVMNKFSNF